MLILSLLASPALACGGFFCNAPTPTAPAPVEQTGEQIVFAMDDESGTVQVQVRVTYAGPAESFAWVVPVPGLPTLGVATNQLFDVLDLLTKPVHTLTYDTAGCTGSF